MSCSALALDREAFTFTRYELDVRLEPEQQRIGVRGRLSIRNDSAKPQKIAVLQISSSLNWRAITLEGKPLQFVSQPLASDIDHTGGLSEAIVTLAREIRPKESAVLEIGYEGTIELDATRLTRIGTPEEKAKNSDWDRISPSFSAVRGIGYVAWYPIATEPASLSEGNSVFATVGRWKSRHASAAMQLSLEVLGEASTVLCNGDSEQPTSTGHTKCAYMPLGIAIPAFVVGDYNKLDEPSGKIYFLPNHEEGARGYASAPEQVLPLISEWFGAPKKKIALLDLPDPGAAPFEAGTLMLVPLSNSDEKLARITVAHALTHAAMRSERPWVSEGLAHFMQAVEQERFDGRQAAIDYMGLHRSAFVSAETALSAPNNKDQTMPQPLVSTFDETYYRSKAMFVWWMLRDMVGESSLRAALSKYRSADDKTAKYVEGLVAAETKRDLSWFFDDWIYNDKGVPDLKVESAFARKTDKGTYLLTVTIENAGSAGAEVPFTVGFTAGEIARRLEVRGKTKATMRVEVPGTPQQIVVNDGSVPESNTADNTFTITQKQF